MADIIWGDVTAVVDGDTFDIKVTHYNTLNKLKYNDAERIRVAGKDAPELNTAAGLIAKKVLETKLTGKAVKCTIQARDTYHRLVCDVDVE